MSQTIVIRNANVLTGAELRLEEKTTLAVEDGRIAGVGDGATAPPGATAIDGAGLLVIPGFVDAHVHIGFADPAEVLRRGVTTVRDLGWPEEAIFPLARASRSPGFEGPLVLAAGPILTAPGGYPTRAGWAPEGTGRELHGPDEAEAEVHRLVAAGAAVVKFALNPPVGPVLDLATLHALTVAAHETEGMVVTGHVYGIEELVKAIACKVDELAHMLMSEEEIDDVLLGAMVASGMVVVPTLSIRAGRDREIAISNVARLRAAGGRVVYGTDLGNEGPGPGIDRTEIRAMVEAGCTALDVVRSATVDAARHLTLAGKGILDEGMDADVVAVPLGALDDAERLSDVRMVWREGVRVR